MRILLVEDEPNLGNAVKEHLASQTHAVDWFLRLDEAGEAVATTNYELILLDLHLPDGRGLDLLRELRSRNDKTPVIIVTARDQISDRIEGLNSGADDYLVKPFDLDELTARVLAVSRRTVGEAQARISFGELEIDETARIASVNGQRIDLTAREWALLEALARRRDAVVSKRVLEDVLYDFGAEIESNALEVYISRLRKKIGRERIQTVRGIGYRLEG